MEVKQVKSIKTDCEGCVFHVNQECKATIEQMEICVYSDDNVIYIEVVD